MKVADLGAGSGHYASEAGRRVGGEGRVYAVDVQKDLLERVAKEAREAGLSNVEIIWGDAEEKGGTKLRDGAVDAVIAANVLFQLDDKEGFAAEAGRILHPKGRILVVDWLDSFGNMGPRPEGVVGKGAARKIFEEAGFSFESEIPAGEHHWGLIFRK